jgi:hypothetical protein
MNEQNEKVTHPGKWYQHLKNHRIQANLAIRHMDR